MKPFVIAEQNIQAGERKRVNLFVARLYDATEMSIPVEIIRGKNDGPTLFISGAIHGNEINGVEIVRLVSQQKELADLYGTLILIPIVNIFGFNNKTRYLPDNRDLNRCFPGFEGGSLASRMAHQFHTEILTKCDFGIDLHTGGNHRYNLPQIRTEIANPKNLELAKSFDVSAIINSSVRDGSLRQAAADLGIPCLLYEGGEALRFNPEAIQIGVRGIFSFMKAIGMLDSVEEQMQKTREQYVAKSSYWLRAPTSGILHTRRRVGEFVKEFDLLATITDPFGERLSEVVASRDGVIIGMTTLPLVTNGDATFHIGVSDGSVPADVIEFSHELSGNDVFDPLIE
jgi:predicted deacylase